MATRALSVTLGAASRLGRRQRNEDACGYWEGAGSLVAVLCDGAGGHGGGQVAARAAVSHVLDAFADRPEISAESLSRLIEGADRAVVAGQVAGTATADMRTTIVVLLLDLYSGAALWAHAGDSRLYRWHDGRLLGRTRDHSLAQSLADEGLRARAGSGELTSALGSPDGFDVEVLDTPQLLEAGDALLLCSDGLWTAVDDATIDACLSDCPHVDAWVDRLDAEVRRAALPDQDNYTALALWCEAG